MQSNAMCMKPKSLFASGFAVVSLFPFFAG